MFGAIPLPLMTAWRMIDAREEGDDFFLQTPCFK
jgi:hypothetical protein